jgi:4-hydroxy-tetrahydrodipicolinate reductase
MRFGLNGASGRMGKAIVSLMDKQDHVHMWHRHPKIQEGIDGHFNVFVHRSFDEVCQHHPDVLIDFSSPEMLDYVVQMATQYAIPLLVGTTGLASKQHHLLRSASVNIPILYSSNTSLGIHVLRKLIRQAAQYLPMKNFDVEIIEAHHRQKIDAPSGTALSLAEDIAHIRGQSLEQSMLRPVNHVSGMQGSRSEGAIGISSIRGGSIVGDHDVMFIGTQEIIGIRHHAQSREVFASGALHAARWLAHQPPGWYGMDDVLKGYSHVNS